MKSLVKFINESIIGDVKSKIFTRKLKKGNPYSKLSNNIVSDDDNDDYFGFKDGLETLKSEVKKLGVDKELPYAQMSFGLMNDEEDLACISKLLDIDEEYLEEYEDIDFQEIVETNCFSPKSTSKIKIGKDKKHEYTIHYGKTNIKDHNVFVIYIMPSQQNAQQNEGWSEFWFYFI